MDDNVGARDCDGVSIFVYTYHMYNYQQEHTQDNKYNIDYKFFEKVYNLLSLKYKNKYIKLYLEVRDYAIRFPLIKWRYIERRPIRKAIKDKMSIQHNAGD